MKRSIARLSGAILVAMTLSPATSTAGSETPPAGPPWTKDFGAALEAAAKDGRPVFLYFTKTY